MRKIVENVVIVNRHHTHGYRNTQYHVSIRYSDGSIDLVWMPADYFIDVFEDRLVLGQEVTFDIDYYNANNPLYV